MLYLSAKHTEWYHLGQGGANFALVSTRALFLKDLPVTFVSFKLVCQDLRTILFFGLYILG